METLLSLTLALCLAAIFGVAAYTKVTAWSELPGVIANFRVLPRAAVMPAAILLPAGEALVCVLLLMPETRATGALIATMLLIVFALAMAQNLRAGRTAIDCGCFRSKLRQPLSAALVVRNAILAGCALYVWIVPAPASAHAVEWVAAGAGALTLMTCYLSFGFVFAPPPPRYEDNFRASTLDHN